MHLLYNLGIRLLQFLYWLGTPFNTKAGLLVNGRKRTFKTLESRFARNTSRVVWFHVASLGEFEQARPIIEKVRSNFSDIKILLSFYSPSGYEVRRNYDKADVIVYLPSDTRNNASRFIEMVNPVLAIFVKYEFWYHFSDQLHQRNIPLLSASSIFRSDQIYFRPYGNFFKGILERFNYFFVQNDESLALLKSIGITHCEKTGDTRFDRVYETLKLGEHNEVAERFKGTDKIMVIGSCWSEDLDVLTPFINENYHFMKFIIAPHEITESFMSTIEESFSANSIRYSKASATELENSQVLIIDNIGLLSQLYKYAEFAFIGGAFGKGLHNILEAACFGIPIFFGNKNYEKFQEAVDLINRGGAFSVSDYHELKTMYEMVNVPQNFLLACEVTKSYVVENLGATDKIVNYCKKLLPS